MYLGVNSLQQDLHLGPSHSFELSHPALGQDEAPEGTTELVLRRDSPSSGSEGGRRGWGPDSWVPGEGWVWLASQPGPLRGGTSRAAFPPPPGPLPSVTHVQQVGGHSDWIILKQVVRLQEKTGSAGVKTEETDLQRGTQGEGVGSRKDRPRRGNSDKT